MDVLDDLPDGEIITMDDRLELFLVLHRFLDISTGIVDFSGADWLVVGVDDVDGVFGLDAIAQVFDPHHEQAFALLERFDGAIVHDHGAFWQ